MKKSIYFAILASALIVSCGEGDKNSENNTENSENQTSESKPEALKNTIMISLKDYGLPLWIIVPDTLMSPLNINVQDWGQIEVRSGNSFQVSIAEGGDLELRKSDIQSDLLYTDPKLIIEEPMGIVYSQGIKGDEFFEPINHFYAIININGVDYEFKDIVGEIKYSEKAVVKMFEAAKATEFDDRKPNS